MKVLKRLKIQAEEKLDKEIKDFVKRAETIEWQSDLMTYKQIQRLGNPLADKIEKKIESLDEEDPKDVKLRDYLAKILENFKKKNYVG